MVYNRVGQGVFMAVTKGFQSIFVGRENELEELKNLLEESIEGKGQFAIISGEAGIGKTRLVQELRSYAISKNVRCLEGNCIHHEVSDPYLPFISAISEITTPSFVDDSQSYVTIDEAFLINNDGNVVSHSARIGASILDEHIVGSMLSAVQSFVKDAFGDKEEGSKRGLETLEYGNLRVLIEHGSLVFLAVVLTGMEPEGIREDLRKFVRKVEDKYSGILTDWDGDLAKVKDIAEIIGGLTTVKYRIRRAIRDIDIKKERDRIFEFVLQIFIDASEEAPILLILEDIHWADISSLQLLQYVVRNTKEARVCICATYRPEELDDIRDRKIHPLKEALQRLSRYKLFTPIELKSLSEPQISDMLKSIFKAPELPGGFANRIYRETEGNPFFTEEMLHSFQDEDVIYFKDGGWCIDETSEIAIPSTIKDLVMLRINRLDEGLMSAIKHASVLGQEFNFDVLKSTLGADEEKTLEAIEDLENKKLIRVDAQDDELYRFTHSKIREVVYKSLGKQRRRMTHEKAAMAIEGLNKDNLERVVYQLAYHYSNTKEHEKTLAYAIKAGDKASSHFALDEAYDYCRLALKSIEGMEDTTDNKMKRLRITTHLGDICYVIGEWDKAFEYYEIVKKLSRDLGDEKGMADAHKNIGLIHLNKNEWDTALLNLEAALEISEGIKDQHCIADTHYNFGTVFERKGEFQKALECYSKCMENAVSIGDSKEIARGYMGIGRVYAQKGEYKESIDSIKKAVEILEKRGDLWELPKAYANLGATYNYLDLDEAIKYHEKAIDIADKTGNIRMKGYALMNASDCLIMKRDDLKRAINYSDMALKIFKKFDERMAISLTYINYANIHRLNKEWEDAVEHFEKALDICRELGTPYNLGDILFEYGLMLKDKGDNNEANRKFAKSLEIFESLQNKELIEKIKKEMVGL